MSSDWITQTQENRLHSFFGDLLEEKAKLAKYTSMRVGGPADYLVPISDHDHLERAVRFLWEQEIPLLIIGRGSNVLISDSGIRRVVLINQARQIEFREDDFDSGPVIWAESGAILGLIARRAASRGWSGLEWAAGIPGTVGGAVVGNAGAHGDDMAESLKMAEILHLEQQVVRCSEWTADDFGYEYRSSVLKRDWGRAVVLTATLQLKKNSPQAVKAKMREFAHYRRETQPGGASTGSMFKNPPGNHAGKLIEEAGLKGTRVGEVEISNQHANFFINHGEASAADVYALIQKAREEVAEQFGIELELEILLVGEW